LAAISAGPFGQVVSGARMVNGSTAISCLWHRESMACVRRRLEQYGWNSTCTVFSTCDIVGTDTQNQPRIQRILGTARRRRQLPAGKRRPRYKVERRTYLVDTRLDPPDLAQLFDLLGRETAEPDGSDKSPLVETFHLLPRLDQGQGLHQLDGQLYT
jgi:hypothetical protein